MWKWIREYGKMLSKPRVLKKLSNGAQEVAVSKKDNYFNREGLLELEEEFRFRQIDIAKALKVSRTTVYNWETGAKKPSPKHIAELAKLFGVDAEYLTGESIYRDDQERFAAADEEYTDIVDFANYILMRWLEIRGRTHKWTVYGEVVDTKDEHGDKKSIEVLRVKKGLIQRGGETDVKAYIFSNIKDRKVNFRAILADTRAGEYMLTPKDMTYFPMEILRYIEMRLDQITEFNQSYSHKTFLKEINDKYYGGDSHS